METKSYVYTEKENAILSPESSLYIKESASELAVLFRVLSGTCIIINKNSDEPVELSRNYFYLNNIGGDEDNANDIHFLDNFEEGLSLSDYESFVFRDRNVNRNYYKSFLNEISGAVYNEHRGRHTAAFVHLYRAYENLSYAFPMIYASKTDNYLGTFQNLKKWMTGSSDGNVGELKFHKSFVGTLFENMPELSTTIDVHIQAKDIFKEAIFDGLVKKVLGWNDESKFTSLTVRPDKISINFLDFHSFIVTLRNRFFHYSHSNKDNIALDDIIESDLLFSLVNQPSLNYISTIFHGVVRSRI